MYLEDKQRKHAIGILKDIKEHYQLQAGGFQFALNAGIEALNDQRWIPVSERLPKEDGVYYVTEKTGRLGTYVFNKKGNSKEYWKRCVAAWWPLVPKPYAKTFEEVQDELRECINHAYRDECEDIQKFGSNVEHLDNAIHKLNELVAIHVENKEKGEETV